jgi:hypothetical protein
LEGASEVTVSSGFAEAEEELSVGEEVAELASLPFFNLRSFRGNFLENPVGTSRSINSRSPRLRINSRMIKLDLHELLDQNGTVKDLDIGSSGKISIPSAFFSIKTCF